MNLRKQLAGTLLLSALSLCLCNVSAAQGDLTTQNQPPEQRDAAASPASPASLPVRAARLTFIAGAVRVQRSDNAGEDTAVLNMPLGEGTRILTGDYGQAEIEFEDGSVARLTPRSALSINVLALDSATTAHSELALLGGLAYFELRRSPGYAWLIDAGGTHITPLENLTLRLNFDDPPATFAVLTGAAHIECADAFEADLHSGETFRADPGDATRYFLTAQLTQESWDSWNESRDRAATDAAGKRTAARDDYAGDQGYGWSDLDANGNWYNVPGTGQVWQPDNADEGFDPYGYGAWVWGNGAYVWASGYSWGWTPFRCGHWQFFNSFGWGWIPNSSCGRWAFAGGGYFDEFGRSGVFVRGPYPPRHNPVIRPFPRPGQPHPVVPVRGPDGPRPWTLHGGPVRIAGASAVPLATLGRSAARGSNPPVSGTLALDYPVDRKTHQPILGNVSTPSSSQPVYGNAAPTPSRLQPGTRRPHPEDTPGLAPVVGTGSHRNPALEPASGVIPTARPSWGTLPSPAPRPSPPTTGEPRPSAPVAPVRAPSTPASSSRPYYPPPPPPPPRATPSAPAPPSPPAPAARPSKF